MQFALKNIKHSEFASEETNCYEATLYIDGKRTATVKNDGNGGADYVWACGEGAALKANYKRIAEAGAWLKTQPNEPCEWDEDGLGQDLELICGNLLTTWLIDRDIKRALKRRVCFTKPGQSGIYELKASYKPTAKNLADYAAAKPEFTILNLLPFDEAKDLWFAAEVGA